MPDQLQQPQFPIQQYNIMDDLTVVFSTTLGPGLAIQQALGPGVVDALFKEWMARKREMRRQQDLAAEVMRTKNMA